MIWSRSCARYAQFIATRMYMCTFHVCLRLLALTFVCNSTYLLKCSFQIYHKSIVVFIRSLKIWFKTTSCANNTCMLSMSVLATSPAWMYYQYICDIGDEKSLWDGCSSICLRIAICCVGLAARNFGNARVVLCTRETIIASSGLQPL